MASYPRQVDTMEQRQQQRADETRQPQQPKESFEVANVHHLLAAINKLESRDKLQAPADRSTKHTSTTFDPANSPTRQSWRVASILDSLSTLLVSKERHEVIAIGLRVDGKNKSVEVILASNGTIQKPTFMHIKWMWHSLTKISLHYHELYPKQTKDDTPTHKIKDEELGHQLHEFTRTCIEFSFTRVKKRINGKFPQFKAFIVQEFESKAGHPFLQVQEPIVMLEALFTREVGARCGMPASQDKHNWKLLLALLRESQRCIKDFLGGPGFTRSELSRVSRFAKWETYLLKIAAIMNDVDVLIKCANSPQCKALFEMAFDVNILPETSSKADKVPITAEDWEQTLERALFQYNILGKQQVEFEPKVLNIPVIKRDTAYMAREVISRNLVVHCEVKVLLHIARTEADDDGNRPANAYSYIGVSKLSCRGCHAFLQAFNKVHGSKFITKGTHGKSYWPWQFPQNFPRSEQTAIYTFNILVHRWANTYNGYVAKTVPLGPDSTAGSQTSQTMIWDQNSKAKDFLRNEKNRFFRR